MLASAGFVSPEMVARCGSTGRERRDTPTGCRAGTDRGAAAVSAAMPAQSSSVAVQAVDAPASKAPSSPWASSHAERCSAPASNRRGSARPARRRTAPHPAWPVRRVAALSVRAAPHHLGSLPGAAVCRGDRPRRDDVPYRREPHSRRPHLRRSPSGRCPPARPDDGSVPNGPVDHHRPVGEDGGWSSAPPIGEERGLNRRLGAQQRSGAVKPGPSRS
jgi:hypothetical protein